MWSATPIQWSSIIGQEASIFIKHFWWCVYLSVSSAVPNIVTFGTNNYFLILSQQLQRRWKNLEEGE